ncbi:MAG: hypothetical protein EON48_04585 [Acetobacteraceae bacterium]|nr:MAG: hypothetical protein EON48_04585 [Acetobacteraceae bacterium]
MITAERAAFRPFPGAAAPHTPYVTTGDPVVVMERRANWVRALYMGGTRPVTGWLPAPEIAMAGDGPSSKQ